MTYPPDQIFPQVAMSTRFISLRPILPEDVDYLYRAQIEILGPGWRHRGTTSSLQSFEAAMWNGSAVQLLGVAPDNGVPIGWFNAYNYEPMDQIVSVAVARLTERDIGRAFLSGLLLFLEYVFRVLSVRKIYFEIAEYNIPLLQSFIGNPLRQEAILVERLVADSRTWNLHILSMSRAQLYEFSAFQRLVLPDL